METKIKHEKRTTKKSVTLTCAGIRTNEFPSTRNVGVTTETTGAKRLHTIVQKRCPDSKSKRNEAPLHLLSSDLEALGRYDPTTTTSQKHPFQQQVLSFDTRSLTLRQRSLTLSNLVKISVVSRGQEHGSSRLLSPARPTLT